MNRGGLDNNPKEIRKVLLAATTSGSENTLYRTTGFSLFQS